MILQRRSLFAFGSLLLLLLVILAATSSSSLRKPECVLIDSILRPTALYFARLCDSGHLVDVHGALVAIRRTLNNKPDGDVSRVGVNLTPAELHRLSCLVKCHETYNTTTRI
jgi:hypothetical protein